MLQKTSWADKIRVTEASTRFTLDSVPRRAPGSILELEDELIDVEDAEWLRCIIGFFPGYDMPFHAARSIAMRAWKASGLEDVRSTSFLIFRFKTEDQVHSILERGPWMFGGKSIVLQQWNPHFSFDKNRISRIPVWVRLHGLPFPLWSAKALSTISSMVGRPLSCDKMTYERTRLSYARVCVEIDAEYSPVHEFDIRCKLSPEPIKVRVEYEWKPKRCAKCCLFGHTCATPVGSSKPSRDAANEVDRVAVSEGKGKSVVVESPPVVDSATASMDTLAPVLVDTLAPVSVEIGRDGPDLTLAIRDTVTSSDSGSESDVGSDSLSIIEGDQDRLIGLTSCILNREAYLSTSSEASPSGRAVVSDSRASVQIESPVPLADPLPLAIEAPSTGKVKNGAKGKRGKGSRGGRRPH